MDTCTHSLAHTHVYIQRQRNLNTTHIQISTLKPKVLKPCSMCILNISINVKTWQHQPKHIKPGLCIRYIKSQHPRQCRKTCSSMCRMFISPPVINDPTQISNWYDSILHLVSHASSAVQRIQRDQLGSGLLQASGCHIRRSTRIWFSFFIHRFLSSLVSALSQFLHRKTSRVC